MPLKNIKMHCKYDRNLMVFDVPNNTWKAWSTPTGTLSMTLDAKDCYYQFVRILRKSFSIITESQHQRNIEALLTRISQDKHNNFEQITKDWLNELYKLKIKDYTCIGVVANYPFNNSFKIGNVEIVPANSQKGKEIIKCIKALIPEVSKFISPESGAIFSCAVKAYDTDSCKVISKNYVKRIFSFIKLLDPQSELRLQIENYRVESEMLWVMVRKRIVEVSWYNNDKIHDRSIPYNYNLIEEQRKLAEKFFFKKNPTSLENSILSALYWYGRVDIRFDDDIDQYISYINGLERLVLSDNAINKAENFGARLSMIYKDLDKENLIRIYKNRNDLLHESEPDIYKEDLEMLRETLRDLILKLIYETDNHLNLYSYFRKKL